MSNSLKLKSLIGFAVLAVMLLAGVTLVATQAQAASCTSFPAGTLLKQGKVSSLNVCLQQMLNEKGFTVSASGAGSAGFETSTFGPKTKLAVWNFQKANPPLVADGVAGSKTLAALTGAATTGGTYPAGCSSSTGFSSTTGLPCSGGGTFPAGCTSATGYSTTTGQPCSGGPATSTGVATAALAIDTPAAGTIPDAANANFTKLTLAAGPTGLNITSLYVTRYGLSVNSDVENIKLLDENLVQVSSSGSLNSNNKAQLTFSPALSIPANTVKTFYIKAGIVDGTTGGKTVAMGIDAASDIIGSTTVGGVFPVRGNYMTTVLLTIGTVTIDEDGTTTDSQPDAGNNDVIVNKFKLTAGSTEGVTIKQIAVERQGTAAATDTANIELYNVSKGQTVATMATWDANGKATFNNLNIVLEKGDTQRFEIRVDVVGGSGLTVNADLTDGSDVLVLVVGNLYGFYITPTNSMTNGQGASNQTIQSGGLTVTKSASTPATGNISSGSDVHLATFDFQVLGEPVKITSINLDSTLGTMVYTEVTNVKLTDATTGALLAGPKDLVVTTEDVTFTDVLILPVGTTKVKVTANIATSVSANDTIKMDLDDPSTGIVAKGMQSNDSITPSPASAVSGNTLTVQAAALSATTITTPAARSVVKGQQDFVWAIVALSAANSGEDVNVTALVVENTVNEAAGGNSGGEDVDNAEIWADLTAANSARGDVFETLVSTTKQFTGTGDADETLSFTLNPYITVPKNGTINIAIVADLSASADTSDTFNMSLDTDAGDVTANGKDTGSSVTVTPTGAGQTMTVSAGGTLTVTVDSSSPSATLLLDNTTAKQTVGVFRLAANNTENLNVDSFKMTDEGTNGNDVVNYYEFYSGPTLLGTVTPDGSGNAELFLTSGQLVVPANDYKLVTVKAVLNDIDGTGFVNGDTLAATVNAAGDVDTTGVASGTAVDSTETNVDAATHTAYEAYPTVTFDSSVTGGNLTLNANQLIGILKVYNAGNKDITFEASDSNLSIQLVVIGDNTNTATENVTIKDQDGNTLDVATFTSATASPQLDFNFSTAALTVAPGETEKIYVYADTSDLEDDNDSIQMWLDDTAADLEFAINNDDGEYTEGDFVFKNDIFGATFTNPS